MMLPCVPMLYVRFVIMTDILTVSVSLLRSLKTNCNSSVSAIVCISCVVKMLTDNGFSSDFIHELFQNAQKLLSLWDIEYVFSTVRP